MDNIDTTQGQASFVSARKDAWHRLGTTLPETFTAEEAMEHGHLGGWNLRKSPVFTIDEVTGERIPMPGRYGVVRTNPITGKPEWVGGDVGESYKIIQNEEHAALLNALVDESGAHFETAGALGNGNRVFITMKLPGHMRIGGVDQIENYIAAVNSHDGSSSFVFMVTPIRIVCQNTLNVALDTAKHVFRVRHTVGAEKVMVQQAREALDLTFGYLEKFQEQAERMINTTLTQSQFEEIIAREFGASEDAAPGTITRADNKIEEMSRLFADSLTHEGVRETAWAGFNALAEWFDHYTPVRNEDKAAARAQKAILESGFKTRALKLFAGV